MLNSLRSFSLTERKKFFRIEMFVGSGFSPDEKGMRCKSATAHSTVKNDETCNHCLGMGRAGSRFEF